jgi:hypothetical protein
MEATPSMLPQTQTYFAGKGSPAMEATPSMVRQAQTYFATATSAALLLAAVVAALVVLTITSSLRNFPIRDLSGFSIPGLTGSDEHPAAARSVPSSTRPRNVNLSPRGRLSSARLPTETRSGAAGLSRAEPSFSAAPPRLQSSSIGADGPGSPAPAPASVPGDSSGPAGGTSEQTSSAPTDPVATPSADPPSIPEPSVSGKSGKSDKGGKSDRIDKIDKGTGPACPPTAMSPQCQALAGDAAASGG